MLGSPADAPVIGGFVLTIPNAIGGATIVALLGVVWRAGSASGKLLTAIEHLTAVVEHILPRVDNHESRISRLEGVNDRPEGRA